MLKLFAEFINHMQKALTTSLFNAYLRLSPALLVAAFSTIAPQSYASEATNSLAASIGYVDNAGFAPKTADPISDTVLEFSAARLYHDTITTSSSVSYGAQLDLKRYLDFPYSKSQLGLNLAYQKKLGLGFNKPRLSLSWRGSKIVHQQSSLDSFTSNIGLAISKPVSEQLDTRISLEHHWEIPDNSLPTITPPGSTLVLPSSTSDLEFTTLQLAGEYYATESWSFPLNIQYIDGDITTILNRRPSLSDTFSAVSLEPRLGENWYRYRFSGQVVASTIAASRLLKDGSSLNFELEYAKGESKANIEYDRYLFSLIWNKSW